MAQDFVKVSITGKDKAFLWTLAGKRNSTKVESSTRKKLRKFTDREIHYLGLKGEFAVASYLELPLDERIFHVHGDDGWDLPDFAVPLAVKFRHVKPDHDPFFFVERMRDFPPGAVGVLVAGNCSLSSNTCQCLNMNEELYTNEELTLIGCIDYESWRQKRREQNFGLGTRWYVRAWHMDPITDLKNYFLSGTV